MSRLLPTSWRLPVKMPVEMPVEMPVKILVAMLLAAVVAWPAAAGELEELPTRAELSQDIAEGLARGEDVSKELAEARAGNFLSAPRLELPTSNIDEELADAVALLRRAASADPASVPSDKAEDGRMAARRAAVRSLRAADLLVRDHFAGVRRTLDAGKMGGEILARLEAAEAAHESWWDDVLPSARAWADGQSGAEPLLDVLDPGSSGFERPILRASTLPYRRIELPPRAPQTEPAIIPVYLDAAAPVAAGRDLDASDDAPLSEAILEQAAALGHDYVAIYEFVQGLRREWYFGAMKGAEQTLLQGAGNDVDQASLLIALLRASGAGARYVQGVAEVPVERLADDFALADPAGVPLALRRAGVPYEAVVQGGRVAAVRLETTWVAAYVPYSNYRGAVVDVLGGTWIPLAPADASWLNVAGRDLFGRMGLDPDDVHAEYLTASRDELPSESVAAAGESFLLLEAPDETFDEQLASHEQVVEPLGLLPSTLPFAVVAVTYEGAELPTGLRHEARVVLRAGPGVGAPALVDVTLPVRELAGRRITLSQIPATVDDHRVSNLYGGLSTVPLYLVRLRAEILVDGRSVAVSEDSFEVGGTQRLEVHLTSPSGGASVDRLMMAGSYAALAVSAQRQVWAPVPEDDADDLEFLAARILSRIARDYDQRWVDGEEFFGGLFDVRVLRPLPSLTLVADEFELDRLGELPLSLRLEALSIDAALRVAEPVPASLGDGTVSAATAARHWMRWAGLEGSALEHRIFEDDFLIPSVSADRVLGLAAEQGLEILTLTDPASPDIDRLTHPEPVVQAVRESLTHGHTVRIPLDPVPYVDWLGSGWWAEDPLSGEAGWFLSGEVAGGMTAQTPPEWLLDFIAPVGSPHLSNPNLDPLSADHINRIEYTDVQKTTVGDSYVLPLGVQVFDVGGLPVEGAEVLFEVLHGGGKVYLRSPEQDGAPELLVKTDYRGLAAVWVESGEQVTDGYSVLLKEAPDDEHPQKALLNIVNASVEGAYGVKEIFRPFELIAFPDEPDHLVRLDDFGYLFETTMLGHIPAWLQVRDQFGNSVANAYVKGETEYGESWDPLCFDMQIDFIVNPHMADGARTEEGGFEGCADVVPTILNSCGEETWGGFTTARGVEVLLLPGSVPFKFQNFEFELPDFGLVEPLKLEMAVRTFFNRAGLCVEVPPVHFVRGLLFSPMGFSYSAAPPQTRWGQDVRLYGFAQWFDPDVPDPVFGNPTDLITLWFLKAPGEELGPNLPYDFPPDVEATGGGEVEPFEAVAEGDTECPIESGYFRTTLTTGEDPAVHELDMLETNRFTGRDLCNVEMQGGARTAPAAPLSSLVKNHTTGANPLSVSSVKVTVEPLVETDQPLASNSDGHLIDDLDVRFEIEPLDYDASSVTIVLLDAQRQHAVVSTEGRIWGEGVLTFRKGLPVHREGNWTVQAIVNQGTLAEVKSEEISVRFQSDLLIDVGWDEEQTYFAANGTRAIHISQDVDLYNGTSCSVGTDFWFEIREDALVTLKFEEVVPIGGTPGTGAITTYWEQQFFEAGTHHQMLLPGDLPPGLHTFELTAVAVEDPERSESYSGSAKVEYSLNEHVPLGRTYIHGVDLANGQLSLQREEFSVPSRVIPMAFRRSYVSGTTDGGPLGVGWRHNWDSTIVEGKCGELIIQGGDGSGMRFVRDGEGFRSLNGYDGSLVQSEDGANFDYYSKSGNRFHYMPVGEKEWLLERIEEPHGQYINLFYGAETEPRRLDRIVNSDGQIISFQHALESFHTWSGWVIQEVKGPGDYSVRFEYDDWGNLKKARRDLKTEEYTYKQDGQEIREFHQLERVEVVETGEYESYTYVERSAEAGNLEVPLGAVTEVERSDGGTTLFDYADPIQVAGGLEFETTVTDARNEETVYTMNQHGAAKEIEDPLGHRTTIEWDLERAQISQRTDAAGVETSYVYDEHGNVISERVSHGGETYTRTYTYFDPSSFDPPYIKDRVQTAVDRNGVETTYEYTEDLRGDLWKVKVRVGDAGGQEHDYEIEHKYYPNGDLKSTEDREDNLTRFEYNSRGQVKRTIDALDGVTEMIYDSRGRKIEETDAEGRKTTFTYDDLDRPTGRELTDLEASWTTRYDDLTLEQFETDARGFETRKKFDTRGRLLEIENAAGALRKMEYDEEGNKKRESNWHQAEDGPTWVEFIYDAAGRLEMRTEPLGRVTEYEHDAVGNLVQETLRDTMGGMQARVTGYGYDLLNRQISVRREGGPNGFVESKIAFDGEGNRISETDALGREVNFEYDQLNRLIRESGPLGSGREILLDGNGNVLADTTLNVNSEGEIVDQVRTWTYDALDRPEEKVDATGGTTTYEYDLVGNVTNQVDPRGHETTTEYRADDLPTKVEFYGDVEGTRTLISRELEYDKAGNVTKETWANENEIEHEYDELNRVTKTWDKVGTMLTRTYTAWGAVKIETDGNGNETENHYDDLERRVGQTLPEGRVVSFVYDAAGNLTEELNARGHKTTYEYDGLDRLISTTDAMGNVESFDYDDVGNQTKVTNRRGFETSTTYNDLNQAVEVQEPLGPAMIYTYDLVGNLLTETDKRGFLTVHQYDAENRRTETTRDDLVIESATYDLAGNRISLTDANGNESTFEYDDRNALVRVNAPLQAITRFELDAMGDRTKEIDPSEKETTRIYDERRRLVSETVGGDETTFAYDGNDNLTEITRPASGTWMRDYDDANRLASITDPSGGVTSYAYDLNDNLTEQTDAAGQTVTLAYDDLDRLSSKTLADDSSESYEYDANGNQTLRTDPNGWTFTSTYDDLDRVTNIAFSGGGTVSPTSRGLGYDDNNNLTSVTETVTGGPSGTTSRVFDPFDRLTSVTDLLGRTVIYGYDNNGNRISVTGGGVSAIYAYDELNRLGSVTSNVGAATYSYFKNGALQRVEYPNSASANYEYDNANRLTRVRNEANAALVSEYEYTYDGNGNRLTQTERRTGRADEETNYTYDDLDRLAEVEYPDQTTVYTYDSVGNRLTEQTTGSVGESVVNRLYTYNSRHQLESLSDLLDPAGSVTYGYDANGNQTTRTTLSGETIFTFDVLNRITEVTHEGASLGSYRYDENGLRILKTTPGDGTSTYLYDDLAVLTRQAGGQTTKYYYGSDRLLAVDDPTEGVGFYLSDALGSVTDIVEPNGLLMARYWYDAWGNYREEMDSEANPFGFTGHEVDDETGLIYAKARFYDSVIGRFLSEDPAAVDPTSPPTLHRYLYAFQNPTIYTDPDGRIEVLKNLSKKLRGGGTENAAELAAGVEQEVSRKLGGFLGKVAGIGTAVVAGVASAAAEATAGVVDAVNLGTNAVIAGVASDTELGQQAVGELLQTEETVKYVAENWREIGGEIKDAAIDTAVGVAQGDVRAITRSTAVIADLATGGRATVAGAGRVSRQVNRARQASRRAARRLDAATPRPAPVRPKPSGRQVEPKYCFVAGTLVATMTGLRPIEEIELGEQVWSRDEATGEVALREVTQLFVTPNQAIYEVDVESENGTVESVGTTAEHPFWVEDLGWVPASRLQPGDRLVSNVGGWLKVRQVRGSPRTETVYNFEVAEYHTYFVGESGVWVHNLCEEGRARLLENLRKNRDVLNARAKARGKGRVRERPSHRQSELDAKAVYGPGYREQVSFGAGNGSSRIEVPYGTEGSTRPDLFSEHRLEAIEVKNYDLETAGGRYRLYRDLGRQIADRGTKLPRGAIQSVLLDARGQIVDPTKLNSLAEKIERVTGGLVKAEKVGVLLDN